MVTKTYGINVKDKKLIDVHNFCVQNDVTFDSETMTIPIITIEKKDV